MESAELVKSLQERAARAQPAERVEHAGGWFLRLAPRCSWWVGTVLPHGDADPDELLRRVVETEDFYAAHGAVPCFQITPRACPEGLDAVLEKRRYRRRGSVSLQTASVARLVENAPTLKVRLDERPTRPWFETWQAVNGESRAEWEMLARVESPSAYASALICDEVAAVGRAVADTGWAGVFSMVTLPRSRGKGAARTVLSALAGWAAANTADHMYLQVERDNGPALRLYERAGFAGMSTYHYRDAG